MAARDRRTRSPRPALALAFALATSSCGPLFIKVDPFFQSEVVTPPVAAPAPEAVRESDATCERRRREVWSNAIYSPDPDFARLARAWPRGPGERQTTIAYCITTGGKTEDIDVTASSGVDAIDQACRRAVAKWRFKPHIIGDQRVRACTEVTFEIRAIRPRRGRR